MSGEPRGSELPHEARGLAPGRARLAGQRVLVIGGGQDDHGVEDPPPGNGRAICVLAAREGAAVAVADIDQASAKRTAELVAKEGQQVVAITGDASKEADMDTIFATAKDVLGGGLDAVVLNVGIGAGFAIAGTSVADWDKVMAINARSHFLGCKLALQHMNDGSIVLIGSVAAREVSPFPAYGASKAALESLCRQAAVEGAPAIRVNLLMPGLIDTPLGRRASALSPHRQQVRIPARRQGTAWEVAYAALFLLSAESSYVTGQSLIVDGGLSIGPRA
jgi:NAD(P)-dependent dehydrogenase (short-subunit alcohol dehydrogenase family)